MIAVIRKIHEWDTLAFLWLHATKKVSYRQSVRWISRSGDGPLYVFITLCLLILDVIPEPNKFLMVAALAYGIELSLYFVLKNSIRRARPQASLNNYQAFIKPSDTFSFPSGHTAAGFVFACLMVQLNPVLGWIVFPWACAVGASRVLLGVHFPSDIAAGAVLGASSAFIAMSVVGV